MQNPNNYSIYLEIGKKKTFACAVDWPGWCRAGRDEASALQALYSYAPRYAEIIKNSDLTFILPQNSTDFVITDRIVGNFATDFGVPDLPIPGDTAPLSDSEMHRLAKILPATWMAFDGAVHSAQGKELRKGPRGGGRELAQIIDHVANAEKGYLRRLGCAAIKIETSDIFQQLERIHAEVLKGMWAASRGELSGEGSRRLKRWPLRYFVRRLAWHVVDHTWEIEDRVISSGSNWG